MQICSYQQTYTNKMMCVYRVLHRFCHDDDDDIVGIVG